MTSTLDLAETKPAPTAPSHNPPFVICASLVGSAAFIVVELVAIKTPDVADPSWGAAVALWFFGGLIGLLTGGLLATRSLHHNPSLAEALAPVVYALTALAVPFLIYMAFVMLVVSALSGMANG